MTHPPLQLAGDFAAPTREDWETEVLKVLNRRRPEGKELSIDQALKRLRTVTVDGLTIEPLYTENTGPLGYPGVAPFTRGAGVRTGSMAAWDISALHEDPDIALTNQAVLADLTRGATSLWLRVDSDAIPAASLAAALAGVDPALAPIAVSSTTEQGAAADALAAFWTASGKAAAVKGSLGIDPLGAAAAAGGEPALDLVGTYATLARNEFPRARAVVVDAGVYDNAGASDSDELAFAIATGVEYLRAMEAAGIGASEAVDQLVFRVSARADQFLTIARLRALRRLWARVTEVAGVEAGKGGAVQHAVTSWRMITRDDPWVNLLRGTIAAFAAAAGGAESITVLPHDAAQGLPDEFSRRMARNIQLLASEESNIGRVADPAGGSFYVEQLTEQLAAKAWARFQAIETAGGMAAALASGMIAEAIGTTLAERGRRLATRKQPITGVSMFPLADETPLPVRPRPARPANGGLHMVRDSEVFEALRDRSARAATKPEVFLACLGARRDFGPREQFTSNVLLVAGLGFPESEGGTTDEIVAQVVASGAPMVILCSSAKVYAAQAVELAEALKAAGIASVFIAGRKAETGDPDAAAIDGEIFDGMDVVGFLSTTLDRLGVEK